MGLNEFRDEAGDFLRNIGAECRDASEIFAMLDGKYSELKASADEPLKLCHPVYDVMFLLFELAAKYEFDLDAEWQKGRANKRIKYLGG